MDHGEAIRHENDRDTSRDDQAVSEKPGIPAEPARSFLVRHRLFLVVLSHALLFASALLAAFSVAYNFRWAKLPSGVYPWFFELFVPLLALALPIKLLVFQWTHQYRCSWRYVGLRDLFGVMSASFIGSFLFLTAFFLLENGWLYLFGHRLFDRGPDPVLRQSAVFSLDWAATVVFVSVAKVLVRFYYEDIQPRPAADQRRVLIVGAGNTGEAVLRELLRLGTERYQCVGFLSDDSAELRGRIHDVEVLGRTPEIRAICKKHDVQEVLIALPHATPKTIRALVQQCEGTGVLFRTMPAVGDVIEGRVQVSSIRNVDIADLLGRDPVQLDMEQIGRVLLGERVLVTGAGGSIGSEMCRQIAAFKPQRLVLVEQAENNLFQIDRELRAKYADLKVVPYVGDVCDRKRIETIMKRERPSVVYHAAAHKHVPMMQINPGEAIKNNIGGTAVVANAALSTGVEKMVLISTDKAVNPTSVMGCTKRITEMYVQSLSERGLTQFVTVRFGNVLGSSGSVVPIFREQIAAGGPVTVTHPDMVRYFMTIPEAAQLVLQAGAMGKGGEIYVLHMGDPVKIFDLARDMIALSGLRPGTDVEITFTGRRPGEKLFEELASDGEDIGDTAHPKIGIWKLRTEDGDAVQRGIADLLKRADSGTVDELQAELKRLVPEYTPDEGLKSPPEQFPHTTASVARP